MAEFSQIDQEFRDFVRRLDLQEIEGASFQRLARIAHDEGRLEIILESKLQNCQSLHDFMAQLGDA